jgi:hypothetical protein
VLFLPLALLVLFGTIYVSQFTVVGSRTQLAVRYGSTTTNTTSLYSVAAIYNELAGSQAAAQCSPPPVAVLWDGAPLPGPTSAQYWQPAGTPTSSCTAQTSKNKGAQFLALYIASTVQTVTATPQVPMFLQKYANISVGTQTTATEAFARTTDPALIMCASKEVFDRVNAALMLATPTPFPTPTGPVPLDNAC